MGAQRKTGCAQGRRVASMNDLQNNPPLDTNSSSKLLNNSEKTKVEVLEFGQILKLISPQIEPYVKSYGLRTDKIKKGQVVAVDVACKLFEFQGYFLGFKADQVFYYNGACWRKANRRLLFDLFVSISISLGMDKDEAQHVDYLNKLWQQVSRPGYDLSEVEPSKEASICLANGVYRFTENPGLTGFDHKDHFYYQLPYGYDESAKAPKFQAFLDQVLPEHDKQRLLQEFVGSVFIRKKQLRLESAMILLGSGANGKSVFREIIFAALGGNENITSYSLKSLTDNSGTTRAGIEGKLLNYVSETSMSADSEYFKQLVSGEPIEAKRLYKDPHIISDYARLMFNSNTLPRNMEPSSAVYRRWLIIPFDKIIPEDQRDAQLAEKIIESDLPGVLNWIIEGMKAVWLQKGYSRFGFSKAIIEEYRLDEDVVARFIQEYGLEKSTTEMLTLKEVYESFKSSCHSHGNTPPSDRVFKQRLTQQFGFESNRASGGVQLHCTLRGLEMPW